MKKKIIAWGSIIAATLIVLVSFSSVANAKTTPLSKDINSLIFSTKAKKTMKEKTPVVQRIKDGYLEGWPPGSLFYLFIEFLFAIIIYILAITNPN